MRRVRSGSCRVTESAERNTHYIATSFIDVDWNPGSRLKFRGRERTPEFRLGGSLYFGESLQGHRLHCFGSRLKRLVPNIETPTHLPRYSLSPTQEPRQPSQSTSIVVSGITGRPWSARISLIQRGFFRSSAPALPPTTPKTSSAYALDFSVRPLFLVKRSLRDPTPRAGTLSTGGA